MDWLEGVKKTHKDDESISNDTVAQAYLENYAHKLFSYADQQDRASNFGKNVVKAFSHRRCFKISSQPSVT